MKRLDASDSEGSFLMLAKQTRETDTDAGCTVEVSVSPALRFRIMFFASLMLFSKQTRPAGSDSALKTTEAQSIIAEASRLGDARYLHRTAG
jgi:hypothetical protein